MLRISCLSLPPCGRCLSACYKIVATSYLHHHFVFAGLYLYILRCYQRIQSVRCRRLLCSLLYSLLFVEKPLPQPQAPPGKPEAESRRSAELGGLRPPSLDFAERGITGSAKSETAPNFVLNFDAGCGQPAGNCRPALQRALQTVAAAGGGAIVRLRGELRLDFPEILNNVKRAPPCSGAPVSGCAAQNYYSRTSGPRMYLGNT